MLQVIANAMLGTQFAPSDKVTLAGTLEKVEKVGERGVRFTFKTPDRELPLILGLLPILPKHAINADTFDKSTLTPMVGSGPYRLATVKPGDSVTFKRNPDYWAKDIPSKRGFDNYDEITLTYPDGSGKTITKPDTPDEQPEANPCGSYRHCKCHLLPYRRAYA